MINIFVLEDDPERQAAFRKNLIPANVYIAESAEKAKQLLESGIYDVWFLDHDLGGKVFVSSDPEGDNGYAVAKWAAGKLKEGNDVAKPMFVIVHSLNPAGSTNIRAALDEVPNLPTRAVPFAWSKVSIQDNNLTVTLT
mgnify:CR=1 FL=1